MVPMGLAGPSEAELTVPASKLKHIHLGPSWKEFGCSPRCPWASGHPRSSPEFYHVRRETAAKMGTLALGLISQYRAYQGNPWCSDTREHWAGSQQTCPAAQPWGSAFPLWDSLLLLLLCVNEGFFCSQVPGICN